MPKGKCKKCSRVKMVFLLKNNTKHLQENGYNPVRYSFYKTNRQDIKKIIAGMIRGFKNEEIYKNSNVIQFYDFGELFGQFKP